MFVGCYCIFSRFPQTYTKLPNRKFMGVMGDHMNKLADENEGKPKVSEVEETVVESKVHSKN